MEAHAKAMEHNDKVLAADEAGAGGEDGGEDGGAESAAPEVGEGASADAEEAPVKKDEVDALAGQVMLLSFCHSVWFWCNDAAVQGRWPCRSAHFSEVGVAGACRYGTRLLSLLERFSKTYLQGHVADCSPSRKLIAGGHRQGGGRQDA